LLAGAGDRIIIIIITTTTTSGVGDLSPWRQQRRPGA
jgi:hypothetical protein